MSGVISDTANITEMFFKKSIAIVHVSQVGTWLNTCAHFQQTGAHCVLKNWDLDLLLQKHFFLH